MYENIFSADNAPQTTPIRSKHNDISIGSETINTGIEAVLIVSTAVRTARKSLQVLEDKLDEQLVNSTFDLLEVLKERSGNNSAFINAYMSARHNSRIRSL